MSMKHAALLSLLFLLPALHAQVVPDRYIVELEGEPAATYAARSGKPSHRRDAAFLARAAEIGRQQEGARRSVEQSGAQVLDSTHAVMNALIVTAPASQAAGLASIPGVIRVYPVRLYKTTLDHALPIHRVPDAWDQIGGVLNAGLGMKIAIIDTGIDARHPGFQDSSLPTVAGFPLVNQASDLAFTNSKIIVARSYVSSTGRASPASDAIGHGTGVAMAAAGVANMGFYGTITGVAPRAYLGNYKVFPDGTSGAPTDLILKAIDDAVADGMDVINLSLGQVVAARPADDPLVTAIERASAAGRLVVISAGNEGPDPDTISSPGTAPSAITVGSMSNDRVFAGSLGIGDAIRVPSIPGSGPNSSNPVSGPLTDVTLLDPSGLACGPLPAGRLAGSIVLILRGVCTFEAKINAAAAAGALAVVVYTDAARPDAAGMAVGAAVLPAAMVSYADGIMARQRIANGTVPAILDFTIQPGSVSANRLSPYSSRGPNLDTGIKPDLIAVGDSISTATPLLTDGSTKDGYIVESGTSFSSPIVAGAAAVVKQGRPGLTGAQYRSLLINSAAIYDTPLGIQQTGSGFLNLAAALQSTVTAVPSALSFGWGGGGVDRKLQLTLSNVGTATDTVSLSVTPLVGLAAPVLSDASVTLDPGQAKTITVQFSQAGLDPGAYQGYVQALSTRSTVISRVPYWYAAVGQQAAQVTILNSPASGSANSTQALLFRVTDAQGIPFLDVTPVLSFTTGNGRFQSLASVDSQYPGVYEARIRLGTSSGTNVIHIEAGAASKDVTIQVTGLLP